MQRQDDARGTPAVGAGTDEGTWLQVRFGAEARNTRWKQLAVRRKKNVPLVWRAQPRPKGI